tara:strand:+ start:5860 stop:6168 length:309 start_codon:yes stop_codon:yes gene_type:complete
MIELTDQAIVKLVERNINSVRVGITGGGCAGFEYIFAEDQVRNGDEVIDYGKFNILIDQESKPYIEGMTLDYVQEGLQEYFKFLNPHEVSSCGCGVSVQFDI